MINNKIIPILILFGTSNTILASTFLLDSGSQQLRVEQSYGLSDSLYQGKKKTPVSKKSEFERRDIINTSLNYSAGILTQTQLNLGATYTRLNLGDSSRSRLSEASAQVSSLMAKTENSELIGHFGLRAAPDNQSGDNFTAVNDGLTKIDLGLEYLYSFNAFLSGVIIRHTERNSQGSKNQLLTEFYLSGKITRKVFYRTFYQHFRTFGGLDINTTDFNDRFSMVNERYNALGFGLGLRLSSNMVADISFSQKLRDGTIKNTNDLFNIAIGLTRSF